MAFMAGYPGYPPQGQFNPAAWNVESDADRLYHAMKGIGTDDTEMIEIIGGRSRAHLNAVAAAYKAKHGHDLIHDIKGDTSFHYKTLLVALVKPIGIYLADLIHDAVDGAGTKEKELIDVLTQASPYEIAALREAWEHEYKKKHGHLDECLSSEVSFNFRKTLLRLLSGTRMPPGYIDGARVEADAERLYKAGEKRLGTDDSTFIDIMTTSSAEHLQAISQVYSTKHKGHSIEKVIESETSGDYKDTLIALCTPRPIYIAKRVHAAVHGAGTNDSLLIRQFAFNEKPMMMAAAQAYERLFKKSMVHDVQNDTSGDYKKLLLRILSA